MKNNVYETNVKFFTSADYKDAKKRYEKFVERSKCTTKRMKSTIAVYFDDEEDTFKVTLVGSFGDVVENDLYSWDDVSTFIHDTI